MPRIEKAGLRDCQYNAEVNLEASFKAGKKKALAVLATGSGKTYLACLASYRLLNYTSTRRILFLVDRNNLARQAESEFSLFDRTENRQPLSSLYQIKRLKSQEDIKADIVISTIQKLFAVLTGQKLEEDDDKEQEEKWIQRAMMRRDSDRLQQESVSLGDNLKLPPDYFQFIIIDECHRSIYGKWKAVLDYFKDAKMLGLTATPTPEAYAFFNIRRNDDLIENYIYDNSVVDGVNVPARVYRIITNATVHGGVIDAGSVIQEKSKKTGETQMVTVHDDIHYSPSQLDRSVVNENQIESVLISYRDAIYTDLYPDRMEDWAHIPKTLIFAKDDNHATKIVEIVRRVFAEKFEGGEVPRLFAQKITYSAEDPNALICDLRTEKDFRIAVTVTLVATGTDVRPLEVVLFMNDVKSEILYTQMKGRGCRTINDDKLKEVTPNASTKECFYIVDAVGVTENDKTIPSPGRGAKQEKQLTLEQLLEHIAHNEVSDDNLALLRDYCATIHHRYEDNALFGRHMDAFISEFGYAPRTLANSINKALSNHTLPPYCSPSEANSERMNLVFCLIGNMGARKKLLEMQKGYYAYSPEKPDEVLYAGFSKETARDFIDSFEKYLNDNKDSIEALRIIYNSIDTPITYSMLSDLKDKLMAENRLFMPYFIWRNYKILDNGGNVEELDAKQNVNALTHLIQLVRFAFHRTGTLTSLFGGYVQRFNLYCGQVQRELTDAQRDVMRRIAEYVVNEGAISIAELNEIDADLWRKAVIHFGVPMLTTEMQTLSKFILKVA